MKNKCLLSMLIVLCTLKFNYIGPAAAYRKVVILFFGPSFL